MLAGFGDLARNTVYRTTVDLDAWYHSSAEEDSVDFGPRFLHFLRSFEGVIAYLCYHVIMLSYVIISTN